jgi:hypothetical protein
MRAENWSENLKGRDHSEDLGVDARITLECILGTSPFTTASRPALGHTQPSIQWVLGGSFPGGKAAGARS